MKLFTTVFTSLVFADENCATEDAIITVDCREDFSVKLTIDEDCMTKFYPDLDLTDILISPAGEDDDTADNTCYPSTDNNDSAKKYFYSDEDQTAAIAADSAELYFVASQCGLAPTVEELEGEEKLLFKTYLSSKLPDNLSMLFDSDLSWMNDLEIQCIYDITPAVMVNLMPSMAEAPEIENDGPVKIGNDKVSYVTTPDISSGTTISLGDLMEIEFTKIGAFGEFHIVNCEANNNLASDNSDYKVVKLVENGCLGDTSIEPLNQISPTLSGNGKTVTFNQFGFIVAGSNPITLNFNLECTLMLGPAKTADDCAARSPRQIKPRQDEGTTVSLDYSVTPADGEYTVMNSIAVASDGPSDGPRQFADAGENSSAQSIAVGTILAIAVNAL